MAGLDVAVSVLGLLDTAIGLVGRFRDAYERQKELLASLESYYRELENTKTIIQIVNDEDVLQTKAVQLFVADMENLGNRLVGHLRTFDPGNKGPVHQFFHQLIHGSKDEKTLSSIMDKLRHAGMNLIAAIQVAGVGLTERIGDNVLANATVVNRVDRLLREKLGEEKGLKIAELIKDRTPLDDGMVPLDPAELAGLTGGKDYTERTIARNLTRHQALQINGPVGEDIWESITRLDISDNEASGASTQVNYAVTLPTFYALLADHMLKYVFLFVLLYLPFAYVFQRKD